MTMEWATLRREVEELETEFPAQAYLLYAMGLRLRTMDYHALETDYVLDGRDDKKIDFFHLDLETGIATIVQSYYSSDWAKHEPPANKASDLNTAVSWLLESDLDNIPRAAVRASAEQLRDTLSTGEVTRLEIFYLHNLANSRNVDRELGTVQRATQRLLERFGTRTGPEAYVRQIGRDTVDEWRRSQHEAVSIHDDVTLTSTIEPRRLDTAEWHAVIACVPAKQLVALKTKYGDALFSANVRDYLGSRQASRNINRQIAKTAAEEPLNFWVYNNGITLLTHGITTQGNDVRLSGIAIINGAQTTGSLAEAAVRANLGDAQVLVRAISCNDPGLVDSVIRYNNTQNPIKAWELRVIDPIQRRIRDDCEKLGVTYQLRRGTSRSRPSYVEYEKLGPYLGAFYGDPLASHKNKADLFENEGKYRALFDDDTHVKNLLFVYRLGNAVALAKGRIRQRISDGSATGEEQARYGYFRYGAFAFVLIHVCAEVIGLWLRPMETRFKRRVTLNDAILLNQERSEALLAKLAEIALGPAHMYLRNLDAYQALKTQSGVDGVAAHARTIIEQVHQMRSDTYAEFTDNLTLIR